jgi:plasmid replication initiation protein
MSSLLPERHPVRDFFVLDVFDVTPRSDIGSMEHPVFSLSTKPDTRALSYEHDDTKIEIIPGIRGLPTVFDKDILIYCISKLIHLKNAGKPIGPKVRLTTYDLLVSTNKPTNNLGYQRLEASLERLAGTVIKTTIETGDEATVSGFSLISSFEYNRKGSMHADRLRYLEITLSDWLFRAIDSTEVLTIDRDYFRLRSPLDRRLYELARKHCGSKEKWRIGIDKLQKKCGSKQERKHFVRHMRETAFADRLPEYRVELDDDLVVFWRRAGEGASSSDKPATRDPAPFLIPPQEPAGDRRIMVSTQAIERLYDIAPGWDKYFLESAYIAWAKDKEPAHNEDARFLSWAGSFTRGKPSP